MQIPRAQNESIFENMTEVLRQLSDSEVEVYWIAKRFYGFSLEIANDLIKLKELTMHLLLKQNKKLFK